MSRTDLNALLAHLLPIAEETLKRYGEIVPFSGAIQQSGDLRVYVAEFEGEDRPAPEAVLEALWSQLREMATKHEIRAAAVCFNARVTDEDGGQEFDAVYVCFEGAGQEAVEVYARYDLDTEDELLFGQLQGTRGAARVFDQAASA